LKPTRDVMKARTLSLSAAFLVLLACVVVFHPFSWPRPDGRLHIDFLDVGQGDAALVTFPDGQTLLVDGGGRSKNVVEDPETDEPFEPDIRSIGEAVDSAFLWDRGYSRVDYILATHADADHIQGLSDVAKNFTVNTAIFGRTPMRNPNFADVAEALKNKGIPVEIIARGDRLTFGDVKIEVMYPFATDDPDAVSDNDHSLVLRMVYGGRTFLLTGDIERGAEGDLINGGGTVAADLVKVAHHGSRTSSTQAFIDAVRPQYAVISVGRTSRFGHPHPEVVQRWIDSGVKVMRTGERGTISVSTDGSDLEISTFLR
jgi:competence protein ComEC